MADFSCLVVWVVGVADAAADGWRSHGHGYGQDDDRNRRSGGGSAAAAAAGLEGARGGGGGGGGGEAEGRGHAVAVDCVPWEFLKEGLMEHLSGKLTVPSNRRRRVADDYDNENPYGCIGQTSEEEEGEDEEEEESEVDGGSGGEEGSWYGRVDSRRERVLDDRNLDFIRGMLKKKQDSPSLHNRHQPGTAAAPAAGRRRGGGRESDGGGGGINADVISVEEFAAFSRWWAPKTRTVSYLKRDWDATDPVRLHGFVGRFWADLELKRSRPGTFLLRFSERELGMLVISFREHVSRSLHT